MTSTLNPLNPVPSAYRIISREDGEGRRFDNDKVIPLTRLIVERISDGKRFTPVLPAAIWTQAEANSTYDATGGWLVADVWLWMFCTDEYTLASPPRDGTEVS